MRYSFGTFLFLEHMNSDAKNACEFSDLKKRTTSLPQVSCSLEMYSSFTKHPSPLLDSLTCSISRLITEQMKYYKVCMEQDIFSEREDYIYIKSWGWICHSHMWCDPLLHEQSHLCVRHLSRPPSLLDRCSIAGSSPQKPAERSKVAISGLLHVYS